MEKTIYIVRHCSAEGQAANAGLTAEGIMQAEKLAAFFNEIDVDRIVTSPFVRARMTAAPIAQLKGIYYEEDSRLAERTLSSQYLEDWLVKLEETFLDVHLKFEGGESTEEAMERARKVVDELPVGSKVVLVTHGNLMSLLLKSFDDGIGFEEWQALTNPDVYCIQVGRAATVIERVWKDDVLI
ncbi:histidine phosphatase family protein [Sporosarcina thermotolerans]|uniref:Histidine phosphatase family protein n=1 Tax=Sporosarcina thermotolerans TaxID=633404 RepID=A0AAW9A6C9_9BACL|nr:histidine phosphatase family protein [Sporosarcina thermotolerans]MDW0116692.1 histidine phosphatase family protein [Sporosarcina thermotolerans]WHT48886.1 histidine phosphatase family protein [Sporosarcina thermotolerans]